MPLLPITVLKAGSALTRWLLALVLLAWVSLALAWGALHWLIVPRIGEFRPQLEARASQALGLTVRVAGVTAQSNGLIPSFELTDVALIDAQGREALHLPRVLVALSPRSVWQLGFEQIYIDRPELEVRRTADGRVSIGGLDLSATDGRQSDLADWFFAQTEFAIHGGTLRWTDEQRGVEPVRLEGVDVVVRNRGRHHDLRLDATPPSVWGERFSLIGRFLQPLLTRQPGRWQDWDGQLYAAFARVDLSELRRYADLGVDLSQGKGALRAWVDVQQGQLTSGLADVALSEVRVTLGPQLQPLDVLQVQGRLGGRRLSAGVELTAQSLVFDTADGLHWPGGNVRWLSQAADGRNAARGELQADRLDLAALAQIAARLPLESAWRDQLARYAPAGQVVSLAANWQGPPQAPTRYSVKGHVDQLSLAAVAPLPGVRGLSLDVDLNQQSGQASLSMAGGSVDLAGILQDSVVPLDHLSAQANWQWSGDQLAVQVKKINVANADLQGDAQVEWHTGDPATAVSRSRFPGVLDLQARLSRADGRQVHRYLPLVIDPQARDYVREAVQAGSASNVRFAIKGDIDALPEVDPRQGAFRISADVHNARLAYVPRSLQPSGELPWPSLTELSGELVIDRMQLKVRNARARLGDSGALLVTRAQASIADLNHTQVVVDGDIKGPLADMLTVVKQSPLAGLTDQALSRATVSGNATLALKLQLPVTDMARSTVRGSVVLAGNEVQMAPDAPRLTRARGTVNFTQEGLTLAGTQARLLGGDARLDGGLQFVPDRPRAGPVAIRITGSASAEGLRQATELGLIARLARRASGAANYSATLGLRRGTPELLITSSLQGLALDLPAPFRKDLASVLPLRVQTTLLPQRGAADPAQDRLSVSIDKLANVVYERDLSAAEPRVLRGFMAVGAQAQDRVDLPAQGVGASIRLAQLNLDAWQAAVSEASGVPLSGMAAAGGPVYLPDHVALQADSVQFGGRTYSHVLLGASREGPLWRANLDAGELNGYLEYRQPGDTGPGSAGRVYARLSRLTLPPSAENEVEDWLDVAPTSVPALDIVVEHFELGGRNLGRLEVEAINRTEAAQGVREWRLNKFNLVLPEARWTASGNWARASQSAPAQERRRTVMNFKLEIADGGALLSRFGMKDVVRQGSGGMEGQIAWLGSPLKLDYPTLGGAVTVNVASGQFLKSDPGLAKLLGVLSLQALPRRLTLDFRDVFSEGFAFDFVRGDVRIDKGIASTNNLQMKGVNAAVLMEGRADIARETQDLKVVVLPELNAGTASLIASVINPAVGLGSFLAQLFLRRPLIESATQEFHIDGSWADPRVTRIQRDGAATKEATP